MPVYEYQCTVCRKEFEYEHRMSDPPKAVCEACGGQLERLISRTSFAFKGGGWYKDLYASAKPADSGGSGSSAASESAPKPASDSGSSTGGSSSGDSSGGSSTPAGS